MVRLMVREGAGTTSYQALDTAWPPVVQSASVPVCSNACELTL